MCNCNSITNNSAFGVPCDDDSLVPESAFNIDIPDCECGSSGSGTQKPGVTTIRRDDPAWANDLVTYNQPAWIGFNIAVFFNTGNRYLTFEDDGFEILSIGGFTTDPNRFQLLDGQLLLAIF